MRFPGDKVNLYRIFDHLDEGIIVADDKDIIVWISAPAAELLGKNAEKLVGLHIDEVLMEGSEVNLLGETLVSIKLPENTGRPIYITFKYMPLNSKDGKIWKGFVFKDITLLKDLEEELNKHKKDISIVTNNEIMQGLVDLSVTVAQSDATVLIQGESGTGKELIANLIHHHSKRKNMPFVKINCASFPETLLESELFGYVRGAFTGAIIDKPGRFEIADGGTIFLDEIGEMSLPLQAKLLRVLESRSFERLGSNKTIAVDVRIISATNRDLKEEVEKGNFRKDLYYRINVVPISLPPLRERKDDIPLLVRSFLKKLEKKGYRQIRSVSSQVMTAFMNYDWPGNIRELENAIEYSLVCSTGDIIKLEQLPPHIKKCGNLQKEFFDNHNQNALSRGTKERKPYKKVTAEECIKVIKECGNNKARAARLLGIDKATLYRKIKKASQ